MAEQKPIVKIETQDKKPKEEKKVEAQKPEASAQIQTKPETPKQTQQAPKPETTTLPKGEESQKSSEIKKTKETKTQKPQKEKSKKEFAEANGKSLHASKKHCMYICSFIKNKPIDKAISDLEEVIKLKKPIPFKGEIPHRKGNLQSGRYPINASKLFINLLKSLKGNVLVNGLELEKTRITRASASWASRPARRGNVRAKRTNVILIAKEIKPEMKKK